MSSRVSRKALPELPEPSTPKPFAFGCKKNGPRVRKDYNELTKENAIYTVYYEMEKPYRRFDLADGRSATLARTYTDQIWYGEQGQNSIDQSYAIDVQIEDRDDGSRLLRYMPIWSQATLSTGEVDPDIVRNTVALGVQETFEAQDAFFDQ